MKKPRIAVVDDHALFRAGLIQLLVLNNKYEIAFEASEGEEFLEKLSHQAIDLVLLDLDMPHMGGRELTAILRKKNATDPKIIILSMHEDEGHILDLMDLGANGYVLKGADIDQVEEAIESVLKSGIYFGPHVGKLMMNKALVKHKPEKHKLFNYKIDLSERETQILTMICQGQTANEIGEKLFLSPRTIEGHRKRIMDKLKVPNLASLVAYAIKNGLVDI
ncbi:response regulator transcription factor [Marinilongibacter aquaticus]|uniref:response regulator n=1 Tax=Marinilongibacter aquaticus TaxID=2975157 RepID=UPI0021BD25CC|nr:response regulator transcription factor [Marinilongibacter aquaticus]UBM60941.1 response regulator transcription factor [Marinilongibacter aquaticus]